MNVYLKISKYITNLFPDTYIQLMYMIKKKPLVCQMGDRTLQVRLLTLTLLVMIYMAPLHMYAVSWMTYVLL